MMIMGPFSCLLLLPFLFGTITTTEGRRFHFGQCELSSVSFQELKEYFKAIRETVQTQDNNTDVRLLKDSVLHNVPVSETCCLLRHLLRFYVESVFKHYEASNNLLTTKISSLANGFLSIKATLRKCHDQKECVCGNETHRRYNLVLEEYKKLDSNVAVVKALGEIDILLSWMEKFKN